MKITEQVSGSPLRVQRSLRGDNLRALTSGKAGKILPLAYFPLLREDAIRRGPVGVTVRMAETVHPLINAVVVKLYAHLVPFSAFERFSGMDEFNNSYAGDSEAASFFSTVKFGPNQPLWKTLGIHYRLNADVNAAPIEAYNTIVNFRRKARSKHLPLRDSLKRDTLARAFWSHPIMHDVVPDYEQALIDGEIPLGINFDALPPESLLPVTGLAYDRQQVAGFPNIPYGEQVTIYRHEDLPGGKYSAGHKDYGPSPPVNTSKHFGMKISDGRPDVYAVLPDLFEEMRTKGLSVSLSNIELAKQTVAFAKLRQQYQGIGDDHLIDLLMDAIRVPPESLRQPILIGSASGTIQMNERFAMDGENLDMSRTTGAVSLAMNLRTPPINTGGIVMVTAEITPEPLFERLGDRFITTVDPNELPQFLRDYLDPKKVELVENREIDTLHDSPDGLFGYRGLNRGWDRDYTRAGGKFSRPVNDAYVEDRQRFWVVESNNPTLTEDFYLVSNDLPYTPFADRTADPFEILTVSALQIEGNTVFGKKLHEDTGDYQAIVDRVIQEDEE